MAIKNKAYIYIDGINRTPNLVFPLKFGNFLDERLDECRISLRFVKKKEFKPLTPVDIQLINETHWGIKNKVTESVRQETRHFIIANDNATEAQLGSGLYNHELYLIETTKFAECVVVDTITFTNDLGRSYTENAGYAEPQWE